MPFKHHPSKASILSVLNGTAPVSEREQVQAHIGSCARCRIVSEHYSSLLSELSTFRKPVIIPAKPAVATSKTLLLRFAAGVIAAAVFIMFFAWPRHIQTVKASEILSRAEIAQESSEMDKHFYRLHMGATICSTADTVWSQAVARNGSTCAQVRDKLAQTHWDDRQIVSARSYRHWHDALTHRRDSVLHEEPYWTIKTDTDQGALRSASLRVRSSDYRPVELTLEFIALDPVSIVEDQPSERLTSVPSATSPENTVPSTNLQHIDDPADAVEVQAWKLLRELGADSGWEAIVTRSGSEVHVTGFISDGDRRTKLTESFSSIDGVKVNLNHPESLPHRGGDGDAAPLAESALEAAIPDAHQRGERITEIANASQAVVGKVFLYDRLLARKRAMQEGSQANALNSLIGDERTDLLAATTKLSSLLQPLLAIPESRELSEPLSYAQARALDAAILSLYNGAPKRSANLEQTTHLVRSLLSKN
jgi:hypothetical protein